MPHAAGTRISVRGEDFLLTKVEDHDLPDHQILHAQGLSELVQGQEFIFDTHLERDIQVIRPDQTRLLPDQSPYGQQTRLYLETVLRNASFFSDGIEIADQAAINDAAYQYLPTRKALALPRPRLLIADAVGLGKTIEVGIFLAEMIKRGRGQRIMIVALKSILGQFQQEIWARFAIPLMRLDSVGIERIRAELPANKNPFDYYDKTIVSIDTLKNSAKFRHYIEQSRWDIVVIDECHTVANRQSQRGDLAQFLATRCDSLILTSATPHNGKQENFANLMRMIEETAIPASGDFDRAHIEPYFVRRFKKDVANEVSQQFQEREVHPHRFSLTDLEQQFFQQQQALKRSEIQQQGSERWDHLFSIGLFKAYLSSPEACADTLGNRLRKQQQARRTQAEGYHPGEVQALTALQSLVQQIVAEEQDSKFHALLDLLEQWQWQGRKRDPRILLFAERIATLEALAAKLRHQFGLDEQRVRSFTGSMGDTEQQKLVEEFGKEDSDIRLLLASDAGAQGVNFHYYCHRLINYDIPWSVITLDQRNGRIDRFGQIHPPQIHYLLAQPGEAAQDLRSDLSIVQRLIDKEAQIQKTLGDAASVFGDFDPQQEEARVGQAIAQQNPGLIEGSPAAEQGLDWWEMLDEAPAYAVAAPAVARPSFYARDRSYYGDLVAYLQAVDPGLQRGTLSWSPGQLELVPGPELPELRSALYDLPPEAREASSFLLLDDRARIQEGIEKARQKSGAWPRYQVLYDLHPLVRWLMYKLLARIDKGSAMVCHLPQLPAGQAHYLFHGQIANELGQPLLSEFVVVSMEFDGANPQARTLGDFLAQYPLPGQWVSLPVSEDERARLDAQKKQAIQYFHLLWIDEKRDQLIAQMQQQLQDFQRQLHAWQNEAEQQLASEFAEKVDNVFTRQARANRQRHLHSISDQKSRFYQDMTSLDNEPFIRLLSVFYRRE